VAHLRPDEIDVEALNDRLALEHPSDDYYARAPLALRLVERRRLAIIRRFMGNVDGLEVAEVGSGGGHVLQMFRPARLTAIDVSGEYLAVARKNLEGYDVRFLKGEVDKMDLPAASFDRVICTEVLEHVVDPEAVLAAIARLLRLDGVAVITVPNDPLILRLKGVAQRRPFRWLARGRFDWGGDEFHLHRWTPAEFERVLAAHLRVTDRKGAPFRLVTLRACFRCEPLLAARG
jgi:2-polyprenyl-3-methyl-5-hydroxy-6-metoxy-1,4-benzoquinol methylase